MINKLKIITIILILTFTISYGKENKKMFLSYTMNISSPQKDYIIKTKEYRDDSIFYRKDDWEDTEKGPLTFIVKRDKKNVLNYLIIHNLKQIFKITSRDNENNIIEENWLGELNTKSLKEENQKEEQVEGYICKKVKLIDEETGEDCIIWFSEKLKRYLKIESSLQNFNFNLQIKEISEKKIDIKTFKIPEKYEIITVEEKNINKFPVY